MMRRVLDWTRVMSTVSIDVASGRKGDTLAAAQQRATAAVPSASALGFTGSSARLLGTSVRDVAGCALRPLDPDRIAFPDQAGSWQIGKWMREEEQEVFDDPSLLRMFDPPKAPTASVRGSREVWTRVVQRVEAADGLEFGDEDEIPRDPHGGYVKAGYFSIYKDEESDRTITNAIPANSLEVSLGLAHALLAHCVAIGEIVLNPSEKLRGSGRDLPNAYHSAAVSLKRSFRNAVGPWMPAAQWAGTTAYARLLERRASRGLIGAPRRVTACWRTLPMGDLNAVDFMQLAHLNCLRAGGCCSDDSLVTYKRPLPPGSEGVWEGIVVDDYNVIGCVPRGLGPSEAAADTARVRAADAVYAQEGRVPKASKCFDHEPVFHIWGGTVDGEAGSSQAGAALQGRLICLTLRLLYGGRTTPGYWKAVIGLLSYCAFVGGRTAFAMFDTVYFEAADLPDGEVFLPSGKARCEVECLLAFLPFMFVDLRAPVSERFFATDASSRSAAIVESHVPASLAREMWRFRYRKGTGSTELRTLADQFADQMDRALADHTSRALLGLAELAATDAQGGGLGAGRGGGCSAGVVGRAGGRPALEAALAWAGRRALAHQPEGGSAYRLARPSTRSRPRGAG